MKLGYVYSHKNSARKTKEFCFIALRHCRKQVLLLTCLETLSKVEGDIEPIGKFELPKEGWGEAGEMALIIAHKNKYKLIKKDQFFAAGEYPNYKDIEF